MKKNGAMLWITAVLPIIVALAMYSRLPEQVPVHWSIDGTVDSYGSRMTIVLLSCLGLLFTALSFVMRRIDPKSENYSRFSGAYTSFFILLNIMILALILFSVTEALHPGTLSAQVFCLVLIGVIFVIIGNMFPKIKSNFFFGLRTPWTLASETVWYRTHRLSGIIWCIGGILLILAAFLPSTLSVILTMIIIAVLVIIPITISYLLYQNEKK